MTDRETMQQALEALESSRIFVTTREKTKHPEGTEWYDSAITALREALEQPEQEPVAKVVSTAPDRIWLDLGFDPQDETEVLFGELHDVTWSADNASGYGIEYVRATPTAAQRTWVGLTEWEREAIAHACGAMSSDWLVFVEAVEKALKEKNR